MPGDRVVAVLGVGVVPADTPILRADDLGALRGDGVFETAHVRAGQAWLLAEHLDRMSDSAARLELNLPPRQRLIELVGQVLAAWPADQEGALRLVCTRGVEDQDGPVTVYATVAPLPATVRQARERGIAVVTASLGVPVLARPAAPWLLAGAKTLSYAVNMASQRWARAHGADDVLWTSGDGYALEGPTSSLVWLAGATLCTVPAQPTGILAGTTAAWLLDQAGKLGWSADRQMVTPAGLASADGVWFTSAVRGLAAIRSLDGVAMAYSTETTGRIRELLGYA